MGKRRQARESGRELSENRRTECYQVKCADNYKDKVITVSNAPKPTANTHWVLVLGQALL